jgi:pimeloyl-ACP methyl ester carboxylesterase
MEASFHATTGAPGEVSLRRRGRGDDRRHIAWHDARREAGGGRYGSGWTNHAVFMDPSDAPPFDPFARAPRICVPTLFAISPDDEMPGAASEVMLAVFDRIPGPKDLVKEDGYHFEIIDYPSPAFDRTSQAQASLLAGALAVTG